MTRFLLWAATRVLICGFNISWNTVCLGVQVLLGVSLASAQPGPNAPTFLYAEDFAKNSDLAAKAGQAVVFETKSSDSAARLHLAAGEHKFCLESGRDFFKEI
jgi:hypothetical protein